LEAKIKVGKDVIGNGGRGKNKRRNEEKEF